MRGQGADCATILDMELSAYELALIAGGFGIAGTLIGVLGAYRLSLKLANQQFQQLREISKLDAWHVAAHEFISAFSDDLAALEAPLRSSFDYRALFCAAYEAKHSQAVVAFEHFLPEATRFSFRNDWKRHCYGVSSTGEVLSPDDEDLAMDHYNLLFLHYSHEANRVDHDLPRRLGVNAIRKLLSYATAT